MKFNESSLILSMKKVSILYNLGCCSLCIFVDFSLSDIILSQIYSQKVDNSVRNAILSLSALSGYHLSNNSFAKITKESWITLAAEAQFLSGLTDLAPIGPKGQPVKAVLSILYSPEQSIDILNRYLAVLNLSVELSSLRAESVPSFVTVFSWASVTEISSMFSSWLRAVNSFIFQMNTSIVNEIIITVVNKYITLLDSVSPDEICSKQPLFFLTVLDFVYFIDVITKYDYRSDGLNTKTSQVVAKGLSMCIGLFRKLLKDHEALFSDDICEAITDESDNEEFFPRQRVDLDETTYIDEDSLSDHWHKRMGKSTSQDDPYGDITNLFTLDEGNGTSQVDAHRISSKKLSMPNFMAMFHAANSTGGSVDFIQWAVDSKGSSSKNELLPAPFLRKVVFSLGTSIGTLLRTLPPKVCENFTSIWDLNDFNSITNAVRSIIEHPVTKLRGSLLNVVEYLFLAFVQQKIFNIDNCKQLFTDCLIGKSTFWLANVDAFTRRLVFIFTYQLSYKDQVGMCQFNLQVWSDYLQAITSINVQNFVLNEPVLTLSLANDMLFLFHLLPFTESRIVVSKICQSVIKLTEKPQSDNDYPQIGVLLALCDIMLYRFVHELSEQSLKDRLISGPGHESTCQVVFLHNYNSELSLKRTANFEQLCFDHQVKQIPNLDRLGLSSFGLAGGLDGYEKFYHALLKIAMNCSSEIGVEGVGMKTSPIWNTWLSLCYLLQALPPPPKFVAKILQNSTDSMPENLIFILLCSNYLRDRQNVSQWIEDGYSKIFDDLKIWSQLEAQLTISQLLKASGNFFKKIVADFREEYQQFVIDSKIPQKLPSLQEIFRIQLVLSNLTRLFNIDHAVVKSGDHEDFAQYVENSLDLLQWSLYITKFAASRVLNQTETNDRCLHLGVFLEEFANPGQTPSSPTKLALFEQLISKAAARSSSSCGFYSTTQSQDQFSPLIASVEPRQYILNPYFRHLFCVVEMQCNLVQSWSNLEIWKSDSLKLRAELLNNGHEPSLTSAIFETTPFMPTLSQSFKPLQQLFLDSFGEQWKLANGEYLLALSHRLLFAISETSHVQNMITVQKSASLKNAALQCIQSLLPSQNNGYNASIWQRTYDHSDGDSCNLGKMLMSCSEDVLQPQAVAIVCQLLQMSNEFKMELKGVVSTLNHLVDENSVMFLIMSLIASSSQSRNNLEDLILSLVSAQQQVGNSLIIAILNCLLLVCSEALKAQDFPTISDHIFPAVILTTKALPNGNGHVEIFKKMSEFLKVILQYFDDASVSCAASFLSYICRVIKSCSKASLKNSQETEDILDSLFSPLGQRQKHQGSSDVPNSANDLEASDDMEMDDEDLDAKLCTFTQSQKSFINQHWYHCHTCSMIDGHGVCSICARVCHRDHDLSYAKFSSFFCDCGAKEDNSCQAKQRRIRGQQQQQQPSETNQPLITSRFGRIGAGRSRPLPPTPNQQVPMDLRQQQQQQQPQQPPPAVPSQQPISKLKPPIANVDQDAFVIQDENIAKELLSIFNETKLQDKVHQYLGLVCKRLDGGKENFLNLQKRCEIELCQINSNSLPVRFGTPLFGEQTQLDLSSDVKFDSHRVFETDKSKMKQLVEQGKIQLKLVACNPNGGLGYYAVVQAKNRLDLFGLDHTVRYAHAMKANSGKVRSYRPHKLAQLQFSFSLAGVEVNMENDSLLAVYGSSDCEIVLLNSSYTPREQLALQLNLESQQSFINSCRWMPGSNSILAVVVNDAIKIYDVAESVSKPLYHFLLPSCKIVDMAFAIYQGKNKFVLILGSNGHIYVQRLFEDVLATSGPFYVTSTVVASQKIAKSVSSGWKNSAETIDEGGLSLVYSHRLQLLLLTCISGAYMIPDFNLSKKQFESDIQVDVIVNLMPKNARERWVLHQNDAFDHLFPGFFIGCNNQGNCLALAVRSDGVDFALSDDLNHCSVKCCHYFAVPYSPTQICVFGLNNEGKLLKLNVDMNHIPQWTNYSMPHLPDLGTSCDFGYENPVTPKPMVKRATVVPEKIEKPATPLRKVGSYASAASSAVVKFPVDFFEKCQPSQNCDFGGNQLLQTYNRDQLKHRLNPSNGNQFIACRGPFTLTCTNRQPGTILVGVRILIGSHRSDKTPQFFRIFDRTISVNSNHGRWFDCPLTRSETMAAKNKVHIYFGPSSSGTTIVDAVQIFVKTREEFGWTDVNGDSTMRQSPTFASSNKEQTESLVEKGQIQPPIYVISTCQTVIMASLAILRRTEADFDEEIIVNLLKTPTTHQILRSCLAWLFQSSNQARNVTKLAISMIELPESPINIAKFELFLILQSFVALLNGRDNENDSISTAQPEVLLSLIEKYSKLTVDKPFSWSTIPITHLQMSRIPLFTPYLVLLLLQNITKHHSNKLLTSLLVSANVDESFIAQQSIETFYFSNPQSPWAQVINKCALSGSPSISEVASVEKFHSE